MRTIKEKMKYATLFFKILLIQTLFGCTDTEYLSFEGEKNFDLELACEQSNKPLLIYFNSLACVNCRKMEENVLNEENVISQINKNYKFLTLYVDDMEKFEEEDRQYNERGKLIRTNGQLNSDYQIKLTRTGSQPIFVILKNKETIDSLVGYTPNASNFLKFLNKK